ncbi:MAG: PstS family phosphate ABC transporter substrate-binding protein [Thiohalospira sp.]|uniref:PstS family phosphate ABC transporter substrate-binding protein n=1 Tax=Thiohalospira sp. TaxID=3080549 RepID=UPI00397E98E7
MRFKQLVLTLGLTAGFAGTAVAADVDPDIPKYESASGISGNISSVGSDTLANLMTLWSEHFKEEYPNVNVEVQAAGSSTAPPALTEGTSNLGPMSRKMKPEELREFEDKHGYKPTRIRVGIDALAVFVNQDNPIEGLTIPELDAIFSSTRSCGHGEDVKRWGQLGLEGGWANRSIQVYGRNSVSGTYGYFKKNALCDGDFRDGVNEQPGSASVVQSVTESNNAIGYSGIGYKTSGVKTVPLAEEEGEEYVSTDTENILSGDYPLARFLYVYVNKEPNKPLDPKTREFIKLILSREGQEVVAKDGFVPMPKAVVEKELEKIEE